MFHMRNHTLYVAVLTLVFSSAAAAQMAAPEETEVSIIPLADNLHVLMGIGGNILVSTGPDGTFVIDDDIPPMAAKIDAAIKSVSSAPVEMVFNTHWHFDHVGGNEFFAGEGALLIAHDNVRKRMSTAQYSGFFDSETQPSAAMALPVITYDNTATFHLNGHTIRAIHVPPAHTDGDSIVLFEEANVAHLGDVFFNQRYPFIDIDSGGSVSGMLNAIKFILPLLNADTRIVPGHGPVGTVEDLKQYRTMLKLVSLRVLALIDEGKSREEVIALGPTYNFDADWAWQLLPPERWTGLVYDSLVATNRELAKSKNK